MKQAISKKSFRPASLREPRSARTVLLRMAADQERADRIRALKLARPDLTWRRIADHVGVSERAASDWQKKGGIEYANAEKLAGLFDVDVDYIWRGTETATPDPFADNGDLESQLHRIAERLETAETEREEMRRLIEHQNELLEAQTRILDEMLEAAVTQRSAAQHLEKVTQTALATLAARPAPASRKSRSGAA